MTAACCGIGALSRLAIGPHGGTIVRMDFVDFQPTKIVKTISDAGAHAIRGTLDRIDTDVAEGLLFVQFRTRLYMTSAKMAVLLPCLGFINDSGDNWHLGDSLSYSKIIVGPANAPEDTYDNCVPTDFVVTGQKGADPVMIDIGWMGSSYASAAAGTFFTSQTSPAMTEGTVYPFGTGVNNTTQLQIASTTYYMPQVKLSVDYGLVTEYNNNVNVTNACPTNHDITLATSVLYSTCDATTGLFTSPVAGNVTGGAVSLSFSTTINSGNTTTFSFANGKFIARPTRIVKNDFNRLPVVLKGYAQVQGGTLYPALSVVNQVAGV